jgi:hypothetical protein
MSSASEGLTHGATVTAQPPCLRQGPARAREDTVVDLLATRDIGLLLLLVLLYVLVLIGLQVTRPRKKR